MSTYTATVLECDGAGCYRRLVARRGRGKSAHAQIAHLLQIAFWSERDNGRALHYCPECLDNRNRCGARTKYNSACQHPAPVGKRCHLHRPPPVDLDVMRRELDPTYPGIHPKRPG